MDRRTLIKAAALAGVPAGVAACASPPMKPDTVLGAALPADPSPAEILRAR
jgi:hypothetical protein